MYWFIRCLKIEINLELQVKCHSKDKAHLVDGTMVEFKDLFGLGLEDKEEEEEDKVELMPIFIISSMPPKPFDALWLLLLVLLLLLLLLLVFTLFLLEVNIMDWSHVDDNIGDCIKRKREVSKVTHLVLIRTTASKCVMLLPLL